MVELQMAFIGDQDKNIPEEQTTTKFDREVDTTQIFRPVDFCCGKKQSVKI